MNYLIKYSKRKLFKRGVTVSISLLYKCTLDCNYCSLKMGGMNRPFDTVLKTADEWINYIETFPIKIKEIFLTGGEPGIYPEIAKLTNELIDLGYFVTVYTNLTKIGEFMYINESPRLKFQSTYHKDMDKELFKHNYKKMTEYFRVDVDEIETNVFEISSKKNLCTIEDESDTSRLRFDSDGAIYVNCIERNKKHL